MSAFFTLLDATTTGATADPGMQSWFSIAMLAVVFVAFYFIGIRPQKKQEKEQEKQKMERSFHNYTTVFPYLAMKKKTSVL